MEPMERERKRGKRRKGREKESAAWRQRKAFESDYHNRAS